VPAVFTRCRTPSLSLFDPSSPSTKELPADLQKQETNCCRLLLSLSSMMILEESGMLGAEEWNLKETGCGQGAA
jgi:hypothetical protein